jgi:hypothetical protein
MSTKDPEQPNSKFSLADFMKLIVALSIVLAASVATGERHWTFIVVGAVIGNFLADHFATTQFRELFFLLAPPLIGASCASALIFNLNDPVDIRGTTVVALIGILAGFVPAVFTVILVNIVAWLIYRVTGIRLLKFEWNVQEKSV